MADARGLVRYTDATEPQSCPYGEVRRVVTGGEGGVANIHVVRVTEGAPHVHEGYDEVYYVLSGTGAITLPSGRSELRPGAAVVIPAGTPHGLRSEGSEPLEFVIVGMPPLSLDDPRARPVKP
jgi:mannose-6-phosphate isomerase-like protein (cupin superfamily)